MSRYHAVCAVISYMLWGVTLLASIEIDPPLWGKLFLFGCQLALIWLGSKAMKALKVACKADDARVNPVLTYTFRA